MKKYFFLLLMAIAIQQVSYAQKLGKIIGDAVDKTKNATGGGTCTEDEIISGLKNALTIGSENAGKSASKLDGFYKNPAIKIPFPPEAKQMEQKLRSIGMGNQVDKFVMNLNRAAEGAAKEAAPVFVTAIKNMTLTDAVNILKGKDDEATQYLKRTTTAELKVKFKPIVKAALAKVEITKYWRPLFTAYNKIPLVTPMNPDLEEYVTLKAIDGMFYLIAQEEGKIRKDPAARVNDLLKKVFGGGN